jgi:aspartate/methionine/tyrosine aminotransferase
MQRSGIRKTFDPHPLARRRDPLGDCEPNFAAPATSGRRLPLLPRRGFTTYTPNAGIPELRTALASKVRYRNGSAADPSQVIVTLGGIAALYGTSLALCDPGDDILGPDPAWPNYEMIGEVQGLGVVGYPLCPEDGGQPTIEGIERCLTPRTSSSSSARPPTPPASSSTRRAFPS